MPSWLCGTAGANAPGLLPFVSESTLGDPMDIDGSRMTGRLVCRRFRVYRAHPSRYPIFRLCGAPEPWLIVAGGRPSSDAL
jgi:hypothetical protein